jgi:hypothetical protein
MCRTSQNQSTAAHGVQVKKFSSTDAWIWANEWTVWSKYRYVRPCVWHKQTFFTIRTRCGKFEVETETGCKPFFSLKIDLRAPQWPCITSYLTTTAASEFMVWDPGFINLCPGCYIMKESTDSKEHDGEQRTLSREESNQTGIKT